MVLCPKAAFHPRAAAGSCAAIPCFYIQSFTAVLFIFFLLHDLLHDLLQPFLSI